MRVSLIFAIIVSFMLFTLLCILSFMNIKHKTKKQDQQIRSIILENSVVPPAHAQRVFLEIFTVIRTCSSVFLVGSLVSIAKIIVTSCLGSDPSLFSSRSLYSPSPSQITSQHRSPSWLK